MTVSVKYYNVIDCRKKAMWSWEKIFTNTNQT